MCMYLLICIGLRWECFNSGFLVHRGPFLSKSVLPTATAAVASTTARIREAMTGRRVPIPVQRVRVPAESFQNSQENAVLGLRRSLYQATNFEPRPRPRLVQQS